MYSDLSDFYSAEVDVTPISSVSNDCDSDSDCECEEDDEDCECCPFQCDDDIVNCRCAIWEDVEECECCQLIFK